MSWSMSEVGDLGGRQVLVTGSNTGVGYATAELLARKGASLVLACRNLDKGRAALSRLGIAAPRSKARLLQLDLASLASVRQAADTLASWGQPLDVLINNAGLMMPPLGRTTDGFETQFGTNVLGHFAFTGLVLPLLTQARSARVVWLSSVAHWVGAIDFDNLNAERRYRALPAYAQSKLADLMLAYEMQRRLQRGGHATISLAAHPGGTYSDLSRDNALLKLIIKCTSPLMQPTEDGALPSIRAAFDPAARGGEYYGPGRRGSFVGAPTRQRSCRRSHDEACAARLWRTCEDLSGVRWLNEVKEGDLR